MLKLTIDNSYSRIEGLAPDRFKALRKELSYEVDPQQAFYMGGHRAKTRTLLDPKGYFPTGLLARVKAFLGDVPITDARVVPTSTVNLELKLGNIIPYHAQLLAMDAVITNPRGILSMPTGTGKSLVIALLLHTHQVRTLIIVPTLELKRQLTESLTALFGPSAKKYLVIENIDSSTLNKHANFDMLIIDEGHHAAAKTYHKLNKAIWNKIYYRYFLTATPFRNQEHEQLLFEAIAGKVIYKLGYKDSVMKGYIVPVESYYIDLPKVKVSGVTWAQVYKELVTQNEWRNGLISALLRDFSRDKKATLCLVKEVAHGKLLSEATGIPFANGADDESRDYIRQFNSGGIKVLIGTTGIMGEGIDSKPCEYVVIAGLGKAKSAFMQQVGRAVRTFKGKESAKVLLFRDASHKWSLTHFNEQAKILKEEYDIVPTKLELESK